MDIQTRKIEFVRKFLSIQNEQLLSRLEKLLHSAKEESSDESHPHMSSKEFNRRIDKSMEDSKNENLTKLDALIAEIQEWR